MSVAILIVLLYIVYCLRRICRNQVNQTTLDLEQRAMLIDRIIQGR